jgi:hypothetical protein
VSKVSLEPTAWIGSEGVRTLNPCAPVWVSPLSKTSYRKAPSLLTNKANTVQLFSSKDMDQARKMVAQKLQIQDRVNAAAAAAAAAVAARALPCECALLRVENGRLVDGLMSQTRASYRLKEDLRVMLERAQGYKDGGDEYREELRVSEKQVANLERTLDIERRMACEKEMTLQRQLMEVMSSHNRTVAELKRSEALVRALQKHALKIGAELDSARQSVASALRREASAKARGVQLTATLEELVAESEKAMTHMAEMSGQLMLQQI